MSIYTCKLCDQVKDCDFDGCYEYEDGLICEYCNENSGLPEIKPIPKITKRCVEVTTKELKPERLSVPKEIICFLLGENPLDGVWFGDWHPDYTGKFWWRAYLRNTLKPTKEAKK